MEIEQAKNSCMRSLSSQRQLAAHEGATACMSSMVVRLLATVQPQLVDSRRIFVRVRVHGQRPLSESCFSIYPVA